MAKFAVIFKAQLAGVDEAYFSLSKILRKRAMEEFGCVEFVSLELEPGEEVTISYWSSMEQIEAWRNDPQHLQAQSLGKSQWYASLDTQVVDLLANDGASVGLFFLAILPPKEVRDEIRVWQNWVAENFQVKAALGSPPHITIYPPVRWPLAGLSAWKNTLARFAKGMPKIPVTMQGFHHFGEQVVYADVEQSPALMHFRKSFMEYWTQSLGAKSPIHADSYHPHITLAFRNLTPVSFKGIWEKFASLAYNRKFSAGDLVLLKHLSPGWEIEESFPLA